MPKLVKAKKLTKILALPTVTYGFTFIQLDFLWRLRHQHLLCCFQFISLKFRNKNNPFKNWFLPGQKNALAVDVRERIIEKIEGQTIRSQNLSSLKSNIIFLLHFESWRNYAKNAVNIMSIDDGAQKLSTLEK